MQGRSRKNIAKIEKVFLCKTTGAIFVGGPPPLLCTPTPLSPPVFSLFSLPAFISASPPSPVLPGSAFSCLCFFAPLSPPLLSVSAPLRRRFSAFSRSSRLRFFLPLFFLLLSCFFSLPLSPFFPAFTSLPSAPLSSFHPAFSCLSAYRPFRFRRAFSVGHRRVFLLSALPAVTDKKPLPSPTWRKRQGFFGFHVKLAREKRFIP